MIIRSIEDLSGQYCVDFIEDETSGSFTFKVFRKDPEDYGRWSMMADYSRTSYASQALAVVAAKAVLPWLA